MNKEFVLAIFMVISAISVIFTLLNLGYIYMNEGDFSCYVPENLTEKEYLWGELFGYKVYHKGIPVTTQYNSTLILDVFNKEEIEQHKGEYVTITMRWGNSDDENGYQRVITKIEINQNQTLGYYPEGMWHDGYYHRSPYNPLALLGLLGTIPFVIYYLYNRRKEKLEQE